MGPDVLIEAPQNLLAPVELNDLGPQPVQNACKLAGDVSAPDDEHAFRLALEFEDPVGRRRELRARKIGHERASADGDEDVPRRRAPARREFDRVRVGQCGARVQHLHAGVR